VNKTFDRFLVLLGTMGVLIVVMTIVAMATRPPGVVAAGSASTEAAGDPEAGHRCPHHPRRVVDQRRSDGSRQVLSCSRSTTPGTLVHNLEIDGVGVSPDVTRARPSAGTWRDRAWDLRGHLRHRGAQGGRDAGDADRGDHGRGATGGGGHGHGEDTDWGVSTRR
jgi:hypothetical protein